jgi:hypothetical protein
MSTRHEADARVPPSVPTTGTADRLEGRTLTGVTEFRNDAIVAFVQRLTLHCRANGLESRCGQIDERVEVPALKEVETLRISEPRGNVRELAFEVFDALAK